MYWHVSIIYTNSYPDMYMYVHVSIIFTNSYPDMYMYVAHPDPIGAASAGRSRE